MLQASFSGGVGGDFGGDGRGSLSSEHAQKRLVDVGRLMARALYQFGQFRNASAKSDRDQGGTLMWEGACKREGQTAVTRVETDSRSNAFFF